MILKATAEKTAVAFLFFCKKDLKAEKSVVYYIL